MCGKQEEEDNEVDINVEGDGSSLGSSSGEKKSAHNSCCSHSLLLKLTPRIASVHALKFNTDYLCVMGKKRLLVL